MARPNGKKGPRRSDAPTAESTGKQAAIADPPSQSGPSGSCINGSSGEATNLLPPPPIDCTVRPADEGSGGKKTTLWDGFMLGWTMHHRAQQGFVQVGGWREEEAAMLLLLLLLLLLIVVSTTLKLI